MQRVLKLRSSHEASGNGGKATNEIFIVAEELNGSTKIPEPCSTVKRRRRKNKFHVLPFTQMQGGEGNERE